MTAVPRQDSLATPPDALEVRSNLTRSQFLIWTGQQLEPGAPIYNMGWRFDISGEMDPDAFRRAFENVVSRCDSLRTVIEEVDGVPQQRVLDTMAGELAVREIVAEDVDAWVAARIEQPLDLARHTFQSALLRQGSGRSTWVLIQHHILLDALSGVLIYDAVGSAYAKLRRGERPLGEAMASFAAFSRRERARRDRDAQDYWSGQLAAPLRPPRLYARPPRPRTPHSRRWLVPLGPERTVRLEALCAEDDFSGLNPQHSRFQIFLTVLAAWVARVSAEREFALGIVTHGRRTAEERRTAGLFMEIFPLDVRLDPGISFRTLHRRLNEASLDLLRHISPGMSSAEGHSRFNVVLNYVPMSFGTFGGASTRVEWLDHGHIDPGHALWLDVMDLAGTGEPTLGLRFNSSEFDTEQQAQAVDELQRLLEALLEAPDRTVHSVPLAMENSASARLTRSGSSAPVPVPDVLTAFSRHVAEGPELIAVDGDAEPVTRAALDARANAIAVALLEAGVQPHSLVGIHLQRSSDLIAALIGVLKIGAAYVPLDPCQPASRLDAIAEEAGLRVTVTQRPLGDRWSGGGRRIAVEEIPAAQLARLPEPDPDGPAYVIFTSGSTGRPKGVSVGRRALARYAHWAHSSFARGRPAAWALHSAIGFDLTVTSMFAPLVGGGVIRVYREEDGPGDLSILKVFAEDAVDVVKLTPAHLALALEQARPLRRIGTLVLGGEDLGVTLAGRAIAALGEHLTIFNEYGPTEATVGCMLHEFDPAKDTEVSVPIGRPAEATRIYVLDDGLNPSPDDAIGELYVAGPDRLADGYLRQPEATAAAFIPDPFVCGARMYRTGDLASVRPDGVLRYHGRRDEQVKIAGVRVELGEIRRAVLSHPSVNDCVIGFAEPSRARPRRCVECGLGDDHPEARIDASGQCSLCRDYARYRDRAAGYFRTLDDLAGLMRRCEAQRRGPHDCLMLLSGGKDSTYALCRLAEITPRILCATLDNGYIAAGAKQNIQRVCEALGLEHRFMSTPHMQEIFADSLARHANVCNGCFKTIYTLGLRLAREEGIPVIVTGLSRGQLFETRLAPELFMEARVDAAAIDRVVLEARRAYHRVPDAPARRLNGDLFDDDQVFDQVEFVDFYRYCDVGVDEIYSYLAERVPWLRPTDTGRSTNCLINDVGIHVHKLRRGFHNYALPYSWDVRMGHKSRAAALEELDDDIDAPRVERILAELNCELPEAPSQRRLVCHFVPAGPFTTRELRRHLAERLPREMIPAALVPIAQLPLTPNGKVDRAALPHPNQVPAEPENAPTPPRNEPEARLLAVWREVLGGPTIGIDDAFFDCGGDSISAIRIAANATRQGIPVTAIDVLRLQTVSAVARAVAARDLGVRPRPAPRAQLDSRSLARLNDLLGSRSDG